MAVRNTGIEGCRKQRGKICVGLMLRLSLAAFAVSGIAMETAVAIPLSVDFSSTISESVETSTGERVFVNVTEKIAWRESAQTHTADCPSFADLGVEFMRASYWDFSSAVNKVLGDKDVAPADVAPLRSASRVLRTMLEVFAPLLPAPANDNRTLGAKGVWSPDIWNMMADDLDDGTDTLYSFETLDSADDPPSKKDIAKHRKHVMKWKATWDKNDKKFDYGGYVGEISSNVTYTHWAQSEFFWRDRPAPQPDEPGMRAVLELVRTQIHAVSDLATEVMACASMHTGAAHSLALRFYSACSAVLDESVAFGKGLFVPSSPAASALKGLEELTEHYFEMEQLYHDYQHAAKAADAKQTQHALHALDDAWAQLSSKQDKLNMPALLAVLILSLSSPC